jgi:hypothetical protein
MSCKTFSLAGGKFISARLEIVGLNCQILLCIAGLCVQLTGNQ